MKFCLRLLHRFKIIHKDIKPENILYSNCYKNYVLSDFGISHSIYEDLGTPSLTLK
jgi:serine/threonine protein kinase